MFGIEAAEMMVVEKTFVGPYMQFESLARYFSFNDHHRIVRWNSKAWHLDIPSAASRAMDLRLLASTSNARMMRLEA